MEGSAMKQSSSLNEMLQLILTHSREEETTGVESSVPEDDTMFFMNLDTFWGDTFSEYFLNPSGHSDMAAKDDIIFFVCQIYNAAEKPRLEVYRRGSPRIPVVCHPGYNWQETLYLNLIMQQFEYFLTLAICTRSGHNELEVLRKHTLTVYASPSRRQLDIKGTGEEIVYPHIFFIVDNFEEVYRHMTVSEGELVCVELVAYNRRAGFSSVIFLGSVRYEVLSSAYQSKKSTVSGRFGLFSRGNAASAQSGSYAFSQDFLSTPSRLEFVKMRGPHNKGSAEVAVTAVEEAPVSLSRRFAGSMSLLASFVGSNDNRSPQIDRSQLRKSQSSETDEEWIEKQHQQQLAAPQSAPAQDAGSTWLTRSLSTAFTMWGRRPSSQPEPQQPPVPPAREAAVGQPRSRFGSDVEKPRQNELHTFLTYVSLPWQNIIEDILEPSAKPVLTTI